MPISYMSYVSIKIKICHDVDCLMRQLPVVCPPHPHVVISICWTNVHSYLNNFAPWKWQVRRWSTAGFRSVLLDPHALPVPFLRHPCINSSPPLLPPRLYVPDLTLPMSDCLNLREKPYPTHFPPFSRNCSV